VIDYQSFIALMLLNIPTERLLVGLTTSRLIETLHWHTPRGGSHRNHSDRLSYQPSVKSLNADMRISCI
jgi:hypothetical protein